jgi:hypothetical protein
MWHAWGKGKLRKGFSEEERKRSLGRPRRRSEFYVKIDLKEIDMHWIYLAQDWKNGELF